MYQLYHKAKCKCNEEFSINKKTKEPKFIIKIQIEERPSEYPNPEEFTLTYKTFQIKYEKKLSSIAKFLLNSFQKKYLYYAIDDILDLFKSNPIERDNLLTILYSPVLSLQNNLFINFFDIWIYEIYINEVLKTNKFLTNNFENLEQFNYITIKLFYKTKIPRKKKESIW